MEKNKPHKPEKSNTHKRLLKRIAISERERAKGLSVDAFEVTRLLKTKYGL